MKKLSKEKKDKIIAYLALRTQAGDSRKTFLQFSLTTRCQLACRYCHSGLLAPWDMDAETMRKGLDFVIRCDSGEASVQFFGGEPLLRWDLLKEGMSYFHEAAQKRGKKGKISLATNGLLLDQEKLDFLKQFREDVSLVLSFDGILSQDANRPPFLGKFKDRYHKTVLNNLKGLEESGLVFFVNKVTGPDNLAVLERDVEHLVEMGVRSIRLAYRMGIFWETADIQDFLDRVKKEFMKYKKWGFIVDIDHCRDEPVITCSGLTLMPDGGLCVGTTYPLLHFFPHIKEFNSFGSINDYEHIGQLVRNKEKEIKRSLGMLKEKNDEEFRLLANNIYLGIVYENLFRGL